MLTECRQWSQVLYKSNLFNTYNNSTGYNLLTPFLYSKEPGTRMRN